VSLAAAVAAGRRAAEARMTSRVTIRRTAAATIVDGYEVPGWSTVDVAVPFRLQGGSTKTVTVGGVEFQEATAIGHLPAGTDLADGDLLEITVGEWVGSVFRVVEAVKGDQQTARRVPVVEVQRPEEWS
jgi:hypothetical protein